VDLAEVTIRVEDGGGGMVVCDRAVRRRTAAYTATTTAPGRGSGSAEVRRMKRESR
jgi:hypothetical protein